MSDRVDITIILHIYNQACFITECIESINMQDYDGSVEVIAADDGSNDGTLEILRERLRPDIPLRIIYSEENTFKACGGYKDWSQAYQEARGRYVCFLDGDDYWLDPRKLSIQIRALEADLSASFCFHDFKRVGVPKHDSLLLSLPSNMRRSLSRLDLENGRYAYILFGTIMCRNYGFKFRGEMRIISNLDLLFPMWLGKYGYGIFLDELMPLQYRYTTSGQWSSATQKARERMKFRSALLMCSYLISEGRLDVLRTQIAHRLLPELKRFLATED